MSQYNPFIQIY